MMMSKTTIAGASMFGFAAAFGVLRLTNLAYRHFYYDVWRGFTMEIVEVMILGGILLTSVMVMRRTWWMLPCLWVPLLLLAWYFVHNNPAG